MGTGSRLSSLVLVCFLIFVSVLDLPLPTRFGFHIPPLVSGLVARGFCIYQIVEFYTIIFPLSARAPFGTTARVFPVF